MSKKPKAEAKAAKKSAGKRAKDAKVDDVEKVAREAVEKLASAPPQVTRQSLGLPGGACDMRLGHNALDRLGFDIRSVVKARTAFLLAGDDVEKQVVKLVRRQLISEGFEIVEHRIADDASARTMGAVTRVLAALESSGVTADDVIVALGRADVLSLACHIAPRWCGGTTLVHVATDALGALIAPATPRGLDVGHLDQIMGAAGHPRMCIVDLDVILRQPKSSSRMARAIMAQSAILDNAGAFERLAGRAEALLEGDPDAWSEQIADSAKARSRTVSSSSVVVRRSLSYGVATARALQRLLPKADPAELLAEGMRFESRLAVVIDEKVDVEEVFALDALLDALGLEDVPCKLKPKKVAQALRDECFSRSNRFQLPLPLKMGRVRITAIDDEVLADHVEAWCEAHAEM